IEYSGYLATGCAGYPTEIDAEKPAGSYAPTMFTVFDRSAATGPVFKSRNRRVWNPFSGDRQANSAYARGRSRYRPCFQDWHTLQCQPTYFCQDHDPGSRRTIRRPKSHAFRLNQPFSFLIQTVPDHEQALMLSLPSLQDQQVPSEKACRH